MTKSFDEYYKNSEWYGTYESDQMMKEAFEAGQQSKQAEIDELQKRIDRCLDYVFGLYTTCDLDTYFVEKILKGDLYES